MYKLAITLLAAALVAPVLGQDASQIPACILNCTTVSLPAGGCGAVTNVSCVCTSIPFQTATGTCIAQNCPDLAANATAIQASECAALTGNSTASGTGSATGSASTQHTTSSGSTSAPTTSHTGAGFQTASIATGVTLALFGAAISLF